MKLLKVTGTCALLGMSLNALAGGTCPDPALAWDTTNQANGAAYAVTETGAGGTTCALEVTQGPNNNGVATVRDDIASAEPSYRFRFYFEADDFLTTSTVGAQRFKAFVAGNNNNLVDPSIDSRARPALLQMFIVGTAEGARLGGFCRDFNSTGARARFGDGSNPGTVALQAGWNVIEGEIQVGAGDGGCRLWVNNDTEATPDWEQTGVDNNSMEGVIRANLGSTGSTQRFADDFGTSVLRFDEFESRRQTFIGSIPTP